MPDGLFQAKPGLAGRRLRDAAEAAVRDVLAVKRGERFLIVTEADPERFAVAQAVHDAAVRVGAETLLVVQPVRHESAAADADVLRLLEAEPDLVAILTRGRLGADPERIARPLHGKYQHILHYLVAEGRSRAFWSTGVPRALFERMVPIDLTALRRRSDALVARLADAVELRVSGPGGLELALPLVTASAYAEAGDFRAAGSGGELPAGAVRLAVGPGANGRFVADGSVALPDRAELLKAALRLTVEEGRVTRAEGPLAEEVQAAFASAGRLAEQAVASGRLTRDDAAVYAGNVRRVTEVGFGLNPEARVVGVPLVDAKSDGALHLVVGAGSREAPPGAPFSLQVLTRSATVVAVAADGSESRILESGAWVDGPRLAARAASA